MELQLNNKKGLGVSNPGITTGTFKFNYEDIHQINNLKDLFNIRIEDYTFSATINSDTKTPITIETNTIGYKCNRGEGKEGLESVNNCYIKLDIFMDDLLCGMLRKYIITIEDNVG